jgi:hypothetical protein
VRHVPCRRRPPTTPLRRIEGIFVLIPRRPPARSPESSTPKRDGSAPSSAIG